MGSWSARLYTTLRIVSIRRVGALRSGAGACAVYAEGGLFRRHDMGCLD